MNSNIRRHRLLKILTDTYLKGIQPREKVIGISWDELKNKTNCTLEKLIEISAPLYDEKEIDDYDTYGIKGLYVTIKGVSSYTTKKYKKENTKLIFKAAKNWVQTIIPLLSLLIAFYALLTSEYRMKTRDNVIDSLKFRLDGLEKRIIDLDKGIESTDSVKLKEPKK